MLRNPHGFEVLAPVIICLGCLLALVISVREYAHAPRLAQTAATQPDLDRDGRPDTVAREGLQLQVISGAGGLLLAYPGAVSTWQVVSLSGDEYPVLFAEGARDEWAAFTYNPGRGIMQMVSWPDGRMRGYGRLTPAGALIGAEPGTKEKVLILDRLHLRTSR